MAELSLEIAAEVVAASQQNAGEVAGALGRTFDVSLQVSVGASGPLTPEFSAGAWAAPGLAVVIHLGTAGAVALLPEATGLLPPWCAQPDATGKSKLATLAQELGMLLLPDSLMADDFEAAYLPQLAEGLARGAPSSGAQGVPIELTAADGRKGSLQLIWPLTTPRAVLSPPAAPPTPAAEPTIAQSTAPESAVQPTSQPSAAAPVEAPSAPTKPEVPQAAAPASPAPAVPLAGPPKPESAAPPKRAPIKLTPTVQPRPRRAETVADLPSYSRSLLQVRVPLIVTLASKKQPVSEILNLGPGAIIQFNKSCDQMLEIEVGQQRVAEGEAVKVGEKFGIRITSLMIPEGDFLPIKNQRR